MKQTKRTLLSVVSMIGILGTAGMSGCYREVISAKGIGSEAHYPRRAQSSETKIDKAIDDVVEAIED
ncbi:MAG: hypothetical protein ACSHX5_10920 [Phycisphaerales bacterium]